MPDLPELRPSNDRLREGLFSSLASIVALEELSVLDLYAGSGSLGIEAISRGASRCVFVERNRKIADALKRNLSTLGIAEQSTVLCGDVEGMIRTAPGRPYDVVFADPPYVLDCTELPRWLQESGAVRTDTHLIFESRKTTSAFEGLEIVKEKLYGDSVVRVYKFQ